MSTSDSASGGLRRSLPARPNLEHLRAAAKRRLSQLRKTHPDTKLQLHEVQLEVAREYGFPSWRALKSYVEKVLAVSDSTRTQPESIGAAADRKDIARLRELLKRGGFTQAELDHALARGICGSGDEMTVELRFAIADLLLESGANPNGQYGGDYGPVVFAPCEGVDPDAVGYLIEHGADVSFAPIPTKYGMMTPMLHTFTYVRGRNEAKHRCVELLVKHGAVYEPSPWFEIHRGNAEGLERYLKNDPSLLHKQFPEWSSLGNLNLGGGTLLHFAVEFGEKECVDLLMEHGADLNAKAEPTNGVGGQTPIFHALRSWKGAHFGLLRDLVKRYGTKIDWDARAVLQLYGKAQAEPISALEYASGSSREREMLISLGIPAPQPKESIKIPQEMLSKFRDALKNPGDVHAVQELLRQQPALANSSPWAPQWNGSAIEGVAGMCVWHRPRMHEIARMLFDFGAEAELPTLARCGLLKEVRQRLKQDPEALDQPDSQGRTALYRAACVYGAFPQASEVVDELLRHGAQIDIWSACTLGLLERVRSILTADPTSANATDPEGMKPLHWACRNRSGHKHETEIVRLLCEAGATLEAENPTEERMHPLHHCAEWMTKPETAAVLLQFGANLNAIAHGSGMTPLDYAISRGRHPMIAFLTKAGAQRAPGKDDAPRRFLTLVSHGKLEEARRMLEVRPDLVNARGPHPLWGGEPQPLHLAIERNHPALFKWLIEQGADIDGLEAQYDGWTPLLLALNSRRQSMAERLLKLGARVRLPEALMLGDDAAVDALLDSDPTLAQQTMPSLASPLRFARTIHAAERLLVLGASLSLRDRYGATPVESIATAGDAHLPVARYLIERGAEAPGHVLASLGLLEELKSLIHNDPELLYHPKIAISAIECNQVEVLDWLLKSGLPAESRSEEGSRGTLLHAAAWNGRLEMAKLLVHAGADVRSTDEEYRNTPSGWARTALERLGREDCAAVAEYLEESAK